MDIGLQGKRALVLASSQGLGKATAAALIAEGAKVILSSRSEKNLQTTASEIGAFGYVTCDLSQPLQAKAAVVQAAKQLGGLDILVTNCGGPPKGEFASVTRDQWVTSYQELFLSVTEAVEAALPLFQQQRWGRILFITSRAGKEPITKLTVSSALRSGLHSLMKTLSREYAANGITVNALLPGFVDTDRLRELGLSLDELVKQIPIGRLGKPQELGALAAFLCSSAAAYITGQAISFDGGMSQTW